MAIRLWFTLDFELAWGVAENGVWKQRQDSGVYRALHARISEILELFTQYEMPVTWATVGAMITDPERREFDHLPDRAEAYIHDFISQCDAESIDGRELFDKVVAAGGVHTIGCHSFSHLRFDYPEYDVIGVAKDIEISRKAIGESCQHSGCLVLPQNIESNMDALHIAGITHCRTSPLDRNDNKYIRKIRNTFGRYSASALWKGEGVVYNSGTLFFNCPKGERHNAYLLWTLKAATLHAIKNKVDLHYWAHPYNFTMNPALFQVAADYFHWLEAYRLDGRVQCARWDSTVAASL